MNYESFIKNIISSNFLFCRSRNYVTIFFKQEVDRKQKKPALIPFSCITKFFLLCLMWNSLLPPQWGSCACIIPRNHSKGSEEKNFRVLGFFFNYILCLVFKTPCWSCFMMEKREGGLGCSKVHQTLVCSCN